MSILGALLILVFFVVAIWAVNAHLPTHPPVRLVANLVLIVILIVCLLALAGLLDPVSRWRTP